MTNVLENKSSITKRRHEKLKENGILKQDVIFDAPSIAAAFVIGVGLNGKMRKGYP